MIRTVLRCIAVTPQRGGCKGSRKTPVGLLGPGPGQARGVMLGTHLVAWHKLQPITPATFDMLLPRPQPRPGPKKDTRNPSKSFKTKTLPTQTFFQPRPDPSKARDV